MADAGVRVGPGRAVAADPPCRPGGVVGPDRAGRSARPAVRARGTAPASGPPRPARGGPHRGADRARRVADGRARAGRRVVHGRRRRPRRRVAAAARAGAGPPAAVGAALPRPRVPDDRDRRVAGLRGARRRAVRRACGVGRGPRGGGLPEPDLRGQRRRQPRAAGPHRARLPGGHGLAPAPRDRRGVGRARPRAGCRAGALHGGGRAQRAGPHRPRAARHRRARAERDGRAGRGGAAARRPHPGRRPASLDAIAGAARQGRTDLQQLIRLLGGADVDTPDLALVDEIVGAAARSGLAVSCQIDGNSDAAGTSTRPSRTSRSGWCRRA